MTPVTQVAAGMATDSRTLGRVALAARILGALSLLAVGAVHLQQYEKLYSAIPTIGTLFVLSFVGAVVISAGLLSPAERLPGRLGGLAVVALALAGIGQAAMQFVFLAISEQRPLFGFQEPGYDPPAILASRVSEVATVAFLTIFLVVRGVSRWGASRQTAGAAAEPRRHDVKVR
jgi:hypothetical protein